MNEIDSINTWISHFKKKKERKKKKKLDLKYYSKNKIAGLETGPVSDAAGLDAVQVLKGRYTMLQRLQIRISVCHFGPA